MPPRPLNFERSWQQLWTPKVWMKVSTSFETQFVLQYQTSNVWHIILHLFMLSSWQQAWPRFQYVFPNTINCCRTKPNHLCCWLNFCLSPAALEIQTQFSSYTCKMRLWTTQLEKCSNAWTVKCIDWTQYPGPSYAQYTLICNIDNGLVPGCIFCCFLGVFYPSWLVSNFASHGSEIR